MNTIKIFTALSLFLVLISPVNAEIPIHSTLIWSEYSEIWQKLGFGSRVYVDTYSDGSIFYRIEPPRFTIAAITGASPCNSDIYAVFESVIKTYDTNNDGKISSTEAVKSVIDYQAGIINKATSTAVVAMSTYGCTITATPIVTPTVTASPTGTPTTYICGDSYCTAPTATATATPTATPITTYGGYKINDVVTINSQPYQIISFSSNGNFIAQRLGTTNRYEFLSSNLPSTVTPTATATQAATAMPTPTPIPVLSSIEIQTNNQMVANPGIQLAYNCRYSDGYYRSCPSLSWASNNNNIAIVSNTGYVTAQATGTNDITITATSSGVSGSAILKTYIAPTITASVTPTPTQNSYPQNVHGSDNYVCYRGYKLYPPHNGIIVPAWEGQDYSNYYLVYFNNPIEDRGAYWSGGLGGYPKSKVDDYIKMETSYKTRFPDSVWAKTRPLIEEGNQCTTSTISETVVTATATVTPTITPTPTAIQKPIIKIPSVRDYFTSFISYIKSLFG